MFKISQNLTSAKATKACMIGSIKIIMTCIWCNKILIVLFITLLKIQKTEQVLCVTGNEMKK